MFGLSYLQKYINPFIFISQIAAVKATNFFQHIQSLIKETEELFYLAEKSGRFLEAKSTFSFLHLSLDSSPFLI